MNDISSALPSPPSRKCKFVIAGLTYRYRTGHRSALENVSLQIPAGTVTAILGMSASGKTTLLSILGRLIEYRPPQGVVRYFPEGDDGPVDYMELDARSANHLRQERFGFVLQSAYLLPNFSCRQNIEIPLALQRMPRAIRDERLERLLASLDLGPPAERQNGELREAIDKFPSQISGGQQQRVAVLRALVHEPEVVFADEPCANLDPHNANKIYSLLRAWLNRDAVPGGRQRTLVLVTHNAVDAWQCATHFVLLNKGRVCRGRTLERRELGGPDDIQRELFPHQPPKGQ